MRYYATEVTKLKEPNHFCSDYITIIMILTNRLLNKFIHYLGFGLASHLGVECGIPCVGVAKKLYHVDGLVKDAEYREKVYSTIICKFF